MTDKTTNFAARCEYLSALEVHWPDVMKSLRLQAFPVYQAMLEACPASRAWQLLAGLSDALARGASVELSQVELVIRTWAEAHGIRDAWLLEVALQSIHGWSGGGDTSKWTYLPEELDTPRFQPNLGYWIPFYTPWPEFKRLTNALYRREQARYRARVRTLWGEGHPKLSQSAVWTVLWQRGKSPEAIRIHHLKTTGKNVTLGNIQMRVHAFADSAGLSLRASKASPGANVTST